MRRLLPLFAVPVLLLAACGGDDGTTPPPAIATLDDGQGIAEGEPDPNAGSAAGSCLAGDPDCTDESFDGQDVARAVPLSDELPESQDARKGESSGASAQVLDVVTNDGTTLGLAWQGGACDVVQDVMVMEDEAEVRVMVLAGPEQGVDACTMQLVTWSTEVELAADLGTRTVVDLAG